jgi:tight adherence protein B
MKRFALAFILAATVLPSVAAAADSQFSLTPVGRVRFPERAYLLDLPRHAVLTRGHVYVRENGQPVDAFTLDPALSAGRLAIVLALDASNSMQGLPLRQAVGAARGFVNRAGSDAPIGIVAFNQASSILLKPTSNRDSIDRALAKTPATAEGTRIYDALVASIKLVTASGAAGGSIVLLSDGRDTGSAALLARVAAVAHRAHVRIFTVGLKSATFRPGALNLIAKRTGGDFVEATTAGDLGSIYAALGDRLAREYLLDYKSAKAPGDHVTLNVTVDGFGASNVRYVAGTGGAIAPFRRSLGERFWSSPLSLVLVALLAAALVAAAVAGIIRAPRGGGFRSRMAHFVAPAPPVAPTEPESAARLLPSELFLRRSSLRQSQWWTRLVDELAIAEIDISAEQVVFGTAVATILLMFLLGLIGGIFVPLGLFVPLAVRGALKQKLSRVRGNFAEQLPDNLQVLASALRAGHSFSGALSVVAADTDEPSRREFRRVVADDQLGIPVEESLREVAIRMANDDLEQVALVAELQRQTGGNMAEVLDRVVETVRGRFDLRRLVKTLTAQGRMARWIVSLLPAFLALLLSVINPHYIAPLFTTGTGQVLLVISIVMVVSGSLLIRRIVDIKV